MSQQLTLDSPVSHDATVDHYSYGGLVIAAVSTGALLFSLLAAVLGLPLPIDAGLGLVLAVSGVLLGAGLAVRSARTGSSVPAESLPVAALAAAGTALVLMTLYHLASYIRLPVDLLSFSESPFITDIIKFRSGESIYTPPADNNSYPYTPGAPILTYLIASAFGRGDDIAFLRTVQFGYVALAAVIAAGVCDLLARRLLGDRYRHRPLWIAVWVPFLLLVATEPRFNAYTHSLHNDGLALLVSMTAFWLMARWAVERSRWILVAMAVLPAVGFLVKQNQLLWAGVFALYLVAAGGLGFRRLTVYVIGTTAAVVAVVGASYAAWGEPFHYWIFSALGDKQVSVARSGRHLLLAGSYAAMGLIALWVLVLRDRSAAAAVLWGGWALVFGLQTYTSGIGFAANHMGPGVVLAVCWLFVVVLRLWPVARTDDGVWGHAQGAIAALTVLMVFGGLGLVREPITPVPADFERYVAEIEAEFGTLPREQVLLDTGTWPYLQDDILMRDRATPVSLHVGINQPEIGHAQLAATIQRFNDKQYARILAREIDTDQSRYDYQNRGSGVRDAILNNYHEVRRIAPVQGVQKWWPLHLLSEIIVLEPNEAVSASMPVP